MRPARRLTALTASSYLLAAACGGMGGVRPTTGPALSGGPSLPREWERMPVPGSCLAALVPALRSGDATCPSPRPRAPDTLDRVLRTVDLTRCDLTIPRERLERLLGALAQDRFRLPYYDDLHRAPLRLPAFVRETVQWLDDAATGNALTSRAIQVTAQRLGYDVGRVCPFEPAALGPASLAAAVAHLITVAGGTPDVRAIAVDAADVPLPLQEALARILYGAAEAGKARMAAVEKTRPEVRFFLFHGGPGLLGIPWTAIPVDLGAPYRDAIAGDTVDYRALYAAAARLARTIELAGLDRLAGIETGSFRQSTPWGYVIIGGPGDDVYDPAARSELDVDLLLLVDTGGNDVYRLPVGATRSLNNPVSLGFDLGGNDRYGYVESPHTRDPESDSRLVSDAAGRAANGQTRSETARQGGARAGIGFLYDFGAGQDAYRSLRASQGYGQFGVGLLYDGGGDDRYEAEALAQGSGLHGIGLLLDRSGTDEYLSYTLSQGFGYVKGAGVLVDGAGHDRYEVNHGAPGSGGDPLYPAPQAPGQANASLSQGTGLGRHSSADRDADTASGGLGILRDAGTGDDVYVASIFAQGSGYWFGTGILQDGGGNDTYDGLWYVQGAAAHMAMAWFADEGGDDRYNQRLTSSAASLGVGHDLAVAMHLDLGGNDVYRGSGLTLGAGSDQGMGLFVNVGGDDEYDGPAGTGFGSTGGGALTKRSLSEPTYGFFVDAGGTDRYRSPDRPAGVTNDAFWLGHVSAGYAPGSAKGAGGDDGTGAVSLP